MEKEVWSKVIKRTMREIQIPNILSYLQMDQSIDLSDWITQLKDKTKVKERLLAIMDLELKGGLRKLSELIEYES